MKPPPFEYERPESVAEATALLAEHGEEAKVLAGGQSLVPMLNLRLARPSVIIDIGRLDLSGIEVSRGMLNLGALVRHRRLETDSRVANAVPLLTQAAPHIGHLSIRNRGTLGGSIAHADSTAELALCAMATGATFVIERNGQRRELPAEGFFQGPFTTVLEPEDLLTQVQVPVCKSGELHGFAEVSRRSGDFALAAAGVIVPQRGSQANLRIAVVGASASPGLVNIPGSDRPETQADVHGIAAAVAEQIAAGNDEGKGPGAFKLHVLRAVVVDALTRAIDLEKEDVA